MEVKFFKIYSKKNCIKKRIKKHIEWRNNIEYHNFFGKEDKALKVLVDFFIFLNLLSKKD